MTEIRSLGWSQGNVLPSAAVDALSLPQKIDGCITYWVVISHDCDLANNTKEQFVELVPGTIIKKLASASYGKNPRLLQIAFTDTQNTSIVLELVITERIAVSKAELFSYTPDLSLKLSVSNYAVFQRWLAARYFRAAFPEKFNFLIYSKQFESKQDTLANRIETLLNSHGGQIRAILFDLDKGAMIERESPDIYELGIYVLYDSTEDVNNSYEKAIQVAETLQAHFEQAFYQDDSWEGIEMIFCDPISDNVMTIAQQQNLKQWRLEHLSFREESHTAMLLSN